MTLESKMGDKLVIALKVDSYIDGMIGYLPTFDTKIDVSPFFKRGIDLHVLP